MTNSVPYQQVLMIPLFMYILFSLLCPRLYASDIDSNINILDTTYSDTIPEKPTATDTTSLDSTVSQSAQLLSDDSLFSPDYPDTGNQFSADSLSPMQELPEMNLQNNDTTTTDTLSIANGILYGMEFGWSLGGFELTKHWENALPDSLGSFDLNTQSFAVYPDSGIEDSIALFDTAGLVFSLKESPSIYSMSFPVALSLTSLTDTRKLSFSLRGSWMRKVLTAAIGFSGDTSGIALDYRQSINIYSVFLSAAHGVSIPEKYFSISGVERSYFTTGIDLSPCIVATIATQGSSPKHIARLSRIKDQTLSSRRTLYGGSAAARFGLSMMKRVNQSTVTDASISFSLQAYGYFFENRTRVSIKDINPGFTHKDKPLFWTASRFEIAIALLHHPKKKAQNP